MPWPLWLPPRDQNSRLRVKKQPLPDKADRGSGPDGEGLPGRADVVNAKDLRALQAAKRSRERTGTRRPATVAPVSVPMKLLREAPSRSAQPRPWKSAQGPQQRQIVRERLAEADAGVDDQPRARDAGALAGGDARLEQVVDVEHDVVVAAGRPAWSGGRPGRASGTTGRPERGGGTRGCAGSCVSAETSLMMCAPGVAAPATTAALRVSTESAAHGCACRARRSPAARAGAPPRGGTGSEPGRVDSPPMSRMSAPSAASRSACATAASVSAWRPPSEKLSGVTLTMPMIRRGPSPTRPCPAAARRSAPGRPRPPDRASRRHRDSSAGCGIRGRHRAR